MLAAIQSIIQRFNDKPKNYHITLFRSLNVLVVAVIFMLTGIFYVYIQNAMKKQLVKSNLNTIQVLENTTAIMMQEVDRFLQNLSADPIVASFPAWAISENRDIEYLMSFLNQQKRRMALNTYLETGYVYYVDSGTVLDLKGGRIRQIDKMTFQEAITSDSTQRDGDLIRLAVAEYMDEEVSGIQIYSITTSNRKNEVTIVSTLATANVRKNIFMVITLKDAYFSDILSSVNSEFGSSFFIVDSNMIPISQNKTTLTELVFPHTSSELKIALHDESGSVNLSTGKQHLLLSYTTSSLYDWKFVSVTPAQLIYKEVWYSVLLLLGASAFCVFSGIWLASIFSKRLYKPIMALRSMVDSHAEKENSDLQNIAFGIRSLQKERASMEQLLHENMPHMLQSFLQHLILGRGDTSVGSVWERLQFYGSQLSEGCQYLICVYGSGESRSEDAYTERQLNLLSIYQTEIVQSAVVQLKGLSAELIELNDHQTAVILCFQEKDHAVIKQLTDQFLDTVYQGLSHSKRRGFAIGVSPLYDDFEKTSYFYQQAYVAYGYRVVQEMRIIHYSDIQTTSSWNFQYPYDIEKRIFIQLKLGDITEITEELHRYFDFMRNHISDYQDVKYTGIHLLDQTVNFCRETAISFKEIFPDRPDLYNDLIVQNSFVEMENWFVAFLCDIRNYIFTIKENQSVELMQRVLRYIDKNYANPQTDINEIAVHFHFSVSYLVKNFKDSTGKTVKGYITDLRIAKAKQLLEVDDSISSVKEVGESVGYPNTQSFINAFKKQTGETPGQYRKDRLSERL